MSQLKVSIGGWAPFGAVRHEHSMFVADVSSQLFAQGVAVGFNYRTDPNEKTARKRLLEHAVDHNYDVFINLDGDVWCEVGSVVTQPIVRAAMTLMVAAATFDDESKRGGLIGPQELEAMAELFTFEDIAMLGICVPDDDDEFGVWNMDGTRMNRGDWTAPVQKVGDINPNFAMYSCRWFRDRRAMIAASTANAIRCAGGTVLGALCRTSRSHWSRYTASVVGVDWRPDAGGTAVS